MRDLSFFCQRRQMHPLGMPTCLLQSLSIRLLATLHHRRRCWSSWLPWSQVRQIEESCRWGRCETGCWERASSSQMEMAKAEEGNRERSKSFNCCVQIQTDLIRRSNYYPLHDAFLSSSCGEAGSRSWDWLGTIQELYSMWILVLFRLSSDVVILSQILHSFTIAEGRLGMDHIHTVQYYLPMLLWKNTMPSLKILPSDIFSNAVMERRTSAYLSNARKKNA